MDKTKIDVLNALTELWELLPQLRIGQLVAAVSQSARGPSAASVYSVENEEFLSACRHLILRTKDKGANGHEGQQ